MDTVSREVTTRELRDRLSEVLGRAMYGGERIGVTRNGKLAAVVVSVEDLEALEDVEMCQDVEEYRKAKTTDDGERMSAIELREEASPTMAEVLHRSESRTERATGSAVEVLAAVRADRDEQLGEHTQP